MNEKYWDDLIEAVTILKQHATGAFPTHCEHDVLLVMADPAKFSPEELARLEELGFHPGEHDTFKSYRYGSA